MPPRRGLGRGIVKSGNAGTSHLSAAPKDADKEKPLFPPGSKYPLSLLNERCQKNGWEKPEVATHRNSAGYSFVVTLRRHNKKTSQIDSVRLEPHPPFFMPTALEARHWGATYALYRVCNNIQLNRVLPPGPREYWMQLEQEHKAAPDHLKWMYNPDPFAARKEVDARQESAAKRREERATDGAHEGGSHARSGVVENEFTGAVEVKMSASLRELVENAIKKTHDNQSYPLKDPSISNVLSTDLHSSLTTSLKLLSFAPVQIARTLSALSTPSPLTTSLLYSSSSPLEAAISHLLLCLPESDLPPKFAVRGGSESFVQSTHKGTEDLRTRWLLERAVKEAGYPEPIVRRTIFPAASSRPAPITWDKLIFDLGRKLVGVPSEPPSPLPPLKAECDIEERAALRDSEIEALESVYPSFSVVADAVAASVASGDGEAAKYLVIPVPNTPLTLNIVLAGWDPYPLSSKLPPMYISTTESQTGQSGATRGAPPYIRLHILSTVLCSSAVTDLAPGEGIGLVAAGIAEEEWARIQTQGPPDVTDVLRHLVVEAQQKSDTPAVAATAEEDTAVPEEERRRRRREGGRRAVDPRSDSKIIEDYERMKASQQYLSLSEARRNLPAWSARGDFLRAFARSRVVVCVGETGSGKTTQVPQFIYDEYLAAAAARVPSSSSSSSSSPASPSLAQLQVVVTQPRRVAATSVAARVSAERGDDGSVGYAIRGESTATPRTKLLFCTTGVVLRRLGTPGRGLDDVDVIVVDEVHERSVEGDFLLLELRELLKRNKTLRVVLMSATINYRTFADYFGEGTAVVTIPGRTFPVTDSYLEDIIPRIRYVPSAFSKPAQKMGEEQLRAFRQTLEAQGIDAESIRAIETVTRAERIDYQLVAAIATHITSSTKSGAILIFVPGVQEIKRCMEALKGMVMSGGSTAAAEILPLHANLSSEEQRRVFKATAPSKRKIIVATNVAETSITIDDVVYVIDSGRVKETSHDPETGLSRLAETWVSQAAARQRKGRAGRTRPGECYKLYTREQEGRRMASFPVPEILRVPLESLSLSVKAMRETEDVRSFLQKAIDPPKVAAMEKAWSVLEELGAVDQDGNLTALGRHMSLLPVDLRLGKMLVLGSIFDCLDPILTVAACLSCEPLFVSPMEKREEATKARARFMTENSDMLTDVRAYDECMSMLGSGQTQGLRAFCDENFISYRAVRDITSLREEFGSVLASAGFAVPAVPRRAGGGLVKSIIFAGLYPRIAQVRLPRSAIKFDKVQAGAVQRAQEAREFRLVDMEQGGGGDGAEGGRVFVHPGSVLFGETGWKEQFVCYFRKVVTTRPFVRDVSEVPLYALLLFGAPIVVDNVRGRVGICGGGAGRVRVWLKASPRIGVLVDQLRRLLDGQLAEALENAGKLNAGESGVRDAMVALVTRGP